MTALHTAKLNAEKNAFIEELYKQFPLLDRMVNGDLKSKARSVHSLFFPLHIIKHYGNFERPLTEYYEISFSCAIEAEVLALIGLRNGAFSMLRTAFEATIKFLFYQFHPIEAQRHTAGHHDLHQLDYREFLYIFPGLCEISLLNKENVERIWKNLCSYVHCDLKVIKRISYLSAMQSILTLEESEYQSDRNLIIEVIQLIIALIFAAKPNLMRDTEKAYFDAIFVLFTTEQTQELKSKLLIV